MQSRQFIEVASGASGIVRSLASAPTNADNAIIRCQTGTVRWAESAGSWINGSVGLLLSAADPPFRVGVGVPLSSFCFVPVGGTADLQVSYYTYSGGGGGLL